MRRFSLRVQLIAVVTIAIVTMAGGVGWVAYDALAGTIQTNALRMVALSAEHSHRMLRLGLERRTQRAVTFLEIGQQACGRASAENAGCMQRLLEGLVNSNPGILGARAFYNGREWASAGHGAEGELPATALSGQQAWLKNDAHGTGYVVAADAPDGSGIMIRYDNSDIEATFEDPPELGGSGEVFIADSRGGFVSAPRYPGHSGSSHPIDTTPMKRCLSGLSGEIIALDYRNERVIHGFRFVPETGGGCIMANIEVHEAFAPVVQLRNRLIAVVFAIALLFIALAVLLSFTVTRPIASLVRRAELAASGDLDHPVPLDGPAEVRAFALRFDAMMKALKESLRDREDLISIVSHDLRGLVSAVVLSSEILVRQLPDESDAAGKLRATVGRMRRSALRMRELIDSLLDLARIREGTLQLNVETLNVGDAITDIVELLSPLAAQKAITLQTALPETPCMASADPVRIRQVFSNLLGNAVKFTPEGGSVTVALACSGEEVRVSVSDTGPGIPVKSLPRLFDRYWKSGPATSGSAGLGLFIARSVVDAHGGTLTAENLPAGGARFTFTMSAIKPPPTTPTVAG